MENGHPSATQPFISVPAPPSAGVLPIEEHKVVVRLCDTRLSLVIHDVDSVELWAWDWVSCPSLLNIYGDDLAELSNIVFVDTTSCVWSFTQKATSLESGFAAFSLQPGNTARRRCSDALHVDATMIFPPPFHCPCSSSADGFFRQQDDLRILHIIYIWQLVDGSERHYYIAVPVNIISTCIENAVPPASRGLTHGLSLAHWAPWTRIFSVPPGADTWVSYTRYGIRTPPTDDVSPWTYRICDFRPLSPHEKAIAPYPDELLVLSDALGQMPV
ncbi:hypothetical protein PHLGIDRAFT_123627 [Phlebiopsis gigantea 11061_1 CR5-6]|uniref:Uncharacterized protein n=1 Tax=Phlebiopsis gigantea (strain 11061_1 CR5-6) TaxID=745531 RepID=A0A0C3N9H1_PHLG1|nr:hypothetical protein PHLGIDRAFT_123627 [Phlebiopsis gigantea 11061_1 CR5-6]